MRKPASRYTAFVLLCLALTGILAVQAQDTKLSAELQSLIEAERTFAKLSVEKGVRESFITFFADDGINFQPGPVNTKDAFSKRPAPAAPQPFTLNWAPVWGTIAVSGEMGFNTGPFTVTDNTPQRRPTQHGMFFSVWKKQADGSWKVATDIGISTPNAVAPLDAPYRVVGNPDAGKAKARQPVDTLALQTVEREFHQAVQSQGALKAYLNRLSEDGRLHRFGLMPAIGKSAVGQLLAERPLALRCETIKTDLAQSGDFGWTLGRYELLGAQRKLIEKGHYVRVWQRDRKGDWKLLADVTNALPAGEK